MGPFSTLNLRTMGALASAAARFSVSGLVCAFLSSCGVGLNLLGPAPIFSLTSDELRKNDCSAVTFKLTKPGSGEVFSGITASVGITPSSGLAAYKTLTGCQRYDSSDSLTVLNWTAQTSSLEFYIRPDVSGTVSLSASASGIPSKTVSFTASFTQFSRASGPNAQVQAIAVGADGQIYVGGSFTTWGGVSQNLIARVKANGDLDPTFSQNAAFTTSNVRDIAFQTDGKVIVGGNFPDYVKRLLSTGTPDSTFDASGVLDDRAYTLAIQTDGKILVGGTFNTPAGANIARLNTSGTQDLTFSIGTGLNSLVNSIALQSDGKAIVGGDFDDLDGNFTCRLIRMTTLGALDSAFAPCPGSEVFSVAVQSDGKVFAGGEFTDFPTAQRVARFLSANGQTDPSFVQTGTGINDQVRKVVVQPDGKILVGGTQVSYNGISRPYLLRLTSTGALDTEFSQAAAGLNALVNTIALQADGKILIGGMFTTLDGSSIPYFARLTYSGKLD